MSDTRILHKVRNGCWLDRFGEHMVAREDDGTWTVLAIEMDYGLKAPYDGGGAHRWHSVYRVVERGFATRRAALAALDEPPQEGTDA